MTHRIREFARLRHPQSYHLYGKRKASQFELDRIRNELRERGADSYDLGLPETRQLPQLLHEDEHIMGSVYGHYVFGRGALFATNQRVLFVDKKPLFLHCDEIGFLMITGVTYTDSGLVGVVTLHTRQGDFKLHTFNLRNAANFVDYIETRCLQNMNLQAYKSTGSS